MAYQSIFLQTLIEWKEVWESSVVSDMATMRGKGN
jgi:hypothetical protein